MVVNNLRISVFMWKKILRKQIKYKRVEAKREDNRSNQISDYFTIYSYGSHVFSAQKCWLKVKIWQPVHSFLNYVDCKGKSDASEGLLR